MARARREITDGEPIDPPHIVPATGEVKPGLSVPHRIAIGSIFSAMAMGFVGGYLLLPALGFLIVAAILLAVGIMIGLS